MITDDTNGTTEPQAAPRATLLDRTVCLAVNRRKFSNSKKAQLASVTTAADKSLLRLSKRLIDSTELKAINTVDGEMKAFIESICMPSMFKTGVWLLPIPLVERVEQELQMFKEKRQAAVDTFIEVYPDQVRAIEDRLADQYDARNYPTVEQMRLAFSFDWQYVTFGVPGSLKAIKASLFAEEQKKYEHKMQEAATEYRDMLRARTLALVEHLHEQLGTKADGTKRKVYEAQVDKLTEGLKLFELQDATDDSEMKPIIEQARAIMSGVDVKLLRDDDAFKQRVADGLAAVVGQLKTMVVDRSTREIELPDDDTVPA